MMCHPAFPPTRPPMSTPTVVHSIPQSIRRSRLRGEPGRSAMLTKTSPSATETDSGIRSSQIPASSTARVAALVRRAPATLTCDRWTRRQARRAVSAVLRAGVATP